jgi:hypothetical protein
VRRTTGIAAMAQWSVDIGSAWAARASVLSQRSSRERTSAPVQNPAWYGCTLLDSLSPSFSLWPNSLSPVKMLALTLLWLKHYTQELARRIDLTSTALG